jgi:hypothetical protein
MIRGVNSITRINAVLIVMIAHNTPPTLKNRYFFLPSNEYKAIYNGTNDISMGMFDELVLIKPPVTPP